MKLVLASTSPRRAELLSHLGIPFSIEPSTYEENEPEQDVVATVEKYALLKGRDVFLRQSSDTVVISSDTIVVYNNKIFGKPIDRNDAEAILRELSDNEHTVYTSVAFTYKHNNKTVEEVITISTQVQFEKISPHVLEDYLASGEGDDKAGAYGIQAKGLIFIKEIKGSYSNVVGFPINEVLKKLDEIALKFNCQNYQELFKE